MNPRQAPRRQEQTIQIGPRHGYHIDGDHAVINAELHLPPQRSGGAWTLELWATEEPYREGPLVGTKVASLALALPTPIGPYVHQVDARTAAHLPLQGRGYAMGLALVQRGPDGQASVQDFASYPHPETFTAPHFTGAVGYLIQGHDVVLEADGVFNPRLGGNLSGTLSVELWAFPASEPSSAGVRLAACEVDRVPGQSRRPDVQQRVAFDEPPVGRHRLALLLCEWTLADGYVARDRRDFGCLYERLAPAHADASEAPAIGPGRPADRLRLVPPAAPEAAGASDRAPAPAMVSIQTAGEDELARVKGLSLKLAREIIKARPFASVADLIRVRGIGQKTLDRLRGLVTV